MITTSKLAGLVYFFVFSCSCQVVTLKSFLSEVGKVLITEEDSSVLDITKKFNIYTSGSSWLHQIHPSYSREQKYFTLGTFQWCVVSSGRERCNSTPPCSYSQQPQVPSSSPEAHSGWYIGHRGPQKGKWYTLVFCCAFKKYLVIKNVYIFLGNF